MEDIVSTCAVVGMVIIYIVITIIQIRKDREDGN
jgi:hypothetical protein